MKSRFRLGLAAAGLGLLTAAGLATAPPAHASSFNCVTSVGCGTLHTVINFHGGTTVAMDAKYQKATEMVIGYPDLNRDKATSFDKVAHTTHTRTWQDTAIIGGFSSNVCTRTVLPSGPNSDCNNPAGIQGAVFPVITSAGSQVEVRLTLASGIVYDSEAPTNLVNGLGLTGVQASPGGGGTTVVEGFIGLANATAVPNNYGGQTITLKAHGSGVSYSDVITFALHVDGNRVDNPNADLTYYTLVYAPGNVWSNACVTNVDPGGDNTLALRTCSAGRNLDQRFFAEVGGVPQVVSNNDSRSFQIENQFPGSNLFMRDTSNSDPTVPQPDSSDNRQLSVGATAQTWTWGT